MSNLQNDIYYENLLERASDMIDRWLSTPLEEELVQAVEDVNKLATLANLERLSDAVEKAEAKQVEEDVNECY